MSYRILIIIMFTFIVGLSINDSDLSKKSLLRLPWHAYVVDLVKKLIIRI